MSDLLVVAGEASGDRAAAAVVSRLPGVRVVGLGGAALEAAGAELVGDLRRTTALGVGESATRAWAIARAFGSVASAVHKRSIRTALLVNYSDFNARLAPLLHARGVRVLWYGAPQVWAWRPGRVASLRKSVDRMAVVLPFEETLWRAGGVDAHYVGHPALEAPVVTREEARATLGMTPLASTVALMPGSRPHEVDRLLGPMLEAYERVRSDRASVDGAVLLAASLDPRARARAVARAAEYDVRTYDVDATTGALGVLRAFDAALCASGTASLEAALARAIPVVAYRVGLATELVARALVRTEHVALPNVLLGRRAFAELFQRDATPARLARALGRALDRRREHDDPCDEDEALLLGACAPSERVSEILAPCLGLRSPLAAEKLVKARQLLPPAILASLVMLGVRLHAAGSVGFGDSEALYAAYALHPQIAYLDHPGLIGRFASFIAESAHHAPTPLAAHTATALLATLFPWLVAAAARASGADGRGAMLAVLAAICAPELAIGLFAMTPDLLLAFAWTTTIALAAAGLRASPTKIGSGATLMAAGVLAGVAASAKVTGLLLLASLAVTYASRPARGHAKTIWPWAGLVAGGLVFAPIALFEARTGWPMLRHRLVDTPDAGFSFRNAGALVGGQLLYLTPVYAVAAYFVARDLVRARNDDDPVTRLLLAAFVLPIALLIPLALWSHVAEPHWLAPAMLALLFHFARRPDVIGRRLARISLGTAAGAVALVYAWVLVPQMARLTPKSVDARTDISNELYGWSIAMRAVQRIAVGSHVPGEERGELVIVGPHWTVCAQLDAALEGEIPVGCATPVRDDFDDWYPRAEWQRADTVIFVSDSRFDVDPATLLPDHAVAREERVTTMRGGRVARVFTIRVMSRRGAS